MIDEHVHCFNCGRPVATTVKVAGGKTKPAQVHFAVVPTLVPTTQGIAVVEQQKVACTDCAAKGQEAVEKAKAASKLVVPSSVEMARRNRAM